MTTGPQDNLFEQSTMTFGSHLEELRGALIKALTGLLVGFLIGLYFANFVVEIIKVPLGPPVMKKNTTRLARFG